jgi:hypothetical protein
VLFLQSAEKALGGLFSFGLECSLCVSLGVAAVAIEEGRLAQLGVPIEQFWVGAGVFLHEGRKGLVSSQTAFLLPKGFDECGDVFVVEGGRGGLFVRLGREVHIYFIYNGA